MNNLSRFLVYCLLSSATFCSMSAFAQAVPEKSSKQAADSDALFINNNISDNEDALFLSRKAADRATDSRVKDLAKQMTDDYTQILYSMEQLKVARSGSSNQNTGNGQDTHKAAAQINAALSKLKGPDFDTLWVSSLLTMQQAKLNELTLAKESVTNSQLKMAVSGAVPLVRKHVSQLKIIQKHLIRIEIQRKKEEAAKKKK